MPIGRAASVKHTYKGQQDRTQWRHEVMTGLRHRLKSGIKNPPSRSSHTLAYPAHLVHAQMLGKPALPSSQAQRIAGSRCNVYGAIVRCQETHIVEVPLRIENLPKAGEPQHDLVIPTLTHITLSQEKVKFT